MKLIEASINKKLKVIDIEQTNDSCKLSCLGINEGCEICLINCNKTTTIVEVRGCKYILGKEITDCIFVENL
jgi:Fe2+ transport system protein FeoA